MKRPTDRERLLADVLAEAEQTGFRQALLSETLRLAGRRRRTRRLRHAAAAMSVAGLCATLAWRLLAPGALVFTSPSNGYTLVRTAPFPGCAIVTAQSFSNNRALASAAHVAMVRTMPGAGRIRTIDDDTLLALMAPKPAALVRLGPHSARLLFVTPNGAPSDVIY